MARFAMVDGLRGLAALGIALYHIWRYEPGPEPYQSLQVVPWFADWFLQRTWIGVQFLLVVSGFVIAYTLRGTWVTPRDAVAFLTRRVIRLVPPYWVALLVVLLLHLACMNWWNFPSPFQEPLSVTRVLTHLVFLQDVFKQSPLSAGIWTVCIEMQFYVVCVLGWRLAQQLSRSTETQPRPAGWALLLVFGPFALASLLSWNRLDSTEPWVTHFLSYFFLGMVTWWVLDRTLPTSAYVFVLGVAAAHLAIQWKLENGLALVAALSIFVAGRAGHLHDWLAWRWLQYLGSISYSLYLIHYPVSHFVTWFGWHLCDNSPTPVQATLILVACLPASLAAAHFLYVGVEMPSVCWGAWLKSRVTPSA